MHQLDNDIPEDPAKAEYRQGGTLRQEHTHWFRAKFFQQYRLFFRFHAASKLLVLAWVNSSSYTSTLAHMPSEMQAKQPWVV